MHPDQRHGLHPLLIPLARNSHTGEVTGLLRWPCADMGAGKDLPMPLPVVQTQPAGLTLLAPSARLFVLREAASRDALCDPDADRFLGICNSTAEGPVLRKGSAAASRLGLHRYVLAKLGPFPDLYETLAALHAQRGDQQAALVASERCISLFGAWGRSMWFSARLLAKLGRAAEAREAARAALEAPLWTLCADIGTVATAAGYDPAQVKELRTMARMLRRDASRRGAQQAGEAEEALVEAQLLMDRVCSQRHPRERCDWEAVRGAVAEHFDAAGLSKVADLVRTTQ